MSWESFWVPNLVQATLFAAISATVAAAAGLTARWVFRKWVGPWIRTWAANLIAEQQRTTTAAVAAASRAGEAADASRTAAGDARTAGDNSRQANAAIEWLAEQLANRDAVNEDLRERIDRLLGTRARALATERDEEQPTTLLLPLSAGEDGDPTTITGRHRLHTQMVPTVDEGEPE